MTEDILWVIAGVSLVTLGYFADDILFHLSVILYKAKQALEQLKQLQTHWWPNLLFACILLIIGGSTVMAAILMESRALARLGGVVAVLAYLVLSVTIAKIVREDR